MNSKLAYPTFELLSHVRKPSENYYKDDGKDMLEPTRNWCYLADITMPGYHPLRPSAVVKDSAGHQHPLIFYLDNDFPDSDSDNSDTDSDDSHVDAVLDSLVPGNTVAVLYAEKKTFMNMAEGIRVPVEDTNYVYVFRCDRKTVVSEMEKDEKYQGCFACGKKPEASGPALSRCAKCRMAMYCGRECQIAHWNRAHKRLCGDMKVLRALHKLMNSPFRGFKDFNDLQMQ